MRDETTNGNTNDSAGGQNSATRTSLGSDFVGVVIGVRLFRDGTGRLAQLAVGTLVPGWALASGATAHK